MSKQMISTVALALSICPLLSMKLAQAQPSAKPIYALETNCTIDDKESRCKVEVFDGKDTTVYRTSVNNKIISFRLVDRSDMRGAQIWNQTENRWESLGLLSLNFKDSVLCINGNALCMINPNYFASLRQDYPNLRTDLIISRFAAADGRLAAICYSKEACDAGF